MTAGANLLIFIACHRSQGYRIAGHYRNRLKIETPD
jgi:hypothetical protein